MDKNLSTKIIIGLLVISLVALCGFGGYKMITSNSIKEEVVETESEQIDEVEKEAEEKLQNEKRLIEELSGYIPAGYHAFDSEVEGYVIGNVKTLIDIEDTAMIKMAIGQMKVSKEKYVIPESIGTREIYIDGDKVNMGDSVDVFRYSTVDIKKQITKMFGVEKAEKIVFPEYISYGHLSKEFNNMYYLVDGYYIETYGQLGNLSSYSKKMTDYKALDDIITIDYVITRSTAGEVEEQWNSSETFKIDEKGNYIWQSIEKKEK